MSYFFLRERTSAAPAIAIAAIPVIGAKSPVFAAFAFGVVDSCPVCAPAVSLFSVGVSAGVPSTATRLSIAVCTLVTAASTSSWVAFSLLYTSFASTTAACNAAYRDPDRGFPALRVRGTGWCRRGFRIRRGSSCRPGDFPQDLPSRCRWRRPIR